MLDDLLIDCKTEPAQDSNFCSLVEVSHEAKEDEGKDTKRTDTPYPHSNLVGFNLRLVLVRQEVLLLLPELQHFKRWLSDGLPDVHRHHEEAGEDERKSDGSVLGNFKLHFCLNNCL